MQKTYRVFDWYSRNDIKTDIVNYGNALVIAEEFSRSDEHHPANPIMVMCSDGEACAFFYDGIKFST